MKYTRLFNNHSEYVAYTASTQFIKPNVSYCIMEDEPHCTPSDLCQEGYSYELTSEPQYPLTVPGSATSFDLSFSYDEIYTTIFCEEIITPESEIVSIPIEENPTYSPRTISGVYNFNGIEIAYSLTQEAKEETPYDEQYLTFKVLTDGKIYLHSNGGVARTIEYSLNDGAWTQMSATDSATYIDVNANDAVRFRGENQSYATSKSGYTGFGYGERTPTGSSSYDSDAAVVDIEGNIMSLIYGDNFVGKTTFSGGTYNFCSIFKKLKVVSAENLVLPATTLTDYCYRAMFSWCTMLTKAPQLPATTLAKGVYWYMFEQCAITTAPDLLAETLVQECYGCMFTGCTSLNYIKCMAVNGLGTSKCKENWVAGVASSGTFVKSSGVSVNTWTRGNSGIPTDWLVYDDVSVKPPVIDYDGFSIIELTCDTQGATIYYRLNQEGSYSIYTSQIVISEDTFIEAYSELSGEESLIVSQNCQYVSDVPIEYSNRDLKSWVYKGQNIETPYSVNAVDGHSSNYAKGTFTFETSFALKDAEPTYLWFQHADQSAEIYVDNILVEKHWGGYAAFTTDISSQVHTGTNNIMVKLKNNEGNNLAPASADFNFNATLGNVRLLTSTVLPSASYGYDGFHITSTVSDASATIDVKTNIPTGATVICKIDDGNTNIFSATSASTGAEMTFTKTIANPHLWNGTIDPYLYTITLEIYKDNELYHRFVRPYGLRYYEYVIDDMEKVGTVSEPYTGFLLNGNKYLLRGCCMHDDIVGKANALDDTDYTNTFATIQELGLNFLRLAHYPHPKEVYDWCDRLGIIVQTEGPCVNKLQSTMPQQYYEHLTGQYTDMVNQHYNHPCILFWGLSNETSTDNKEFGKQKVEEYTTLIRGLDSERMVGYVLAQGNGANPSAYYNDPDVDWFGCNIYVGWYASQTSNNPSSEISSRINNTVKRVGKPVAYSEYGCGGTQKSHSLSPSSTTNKGSGGARHDIEYMMWLHEGHIAAIKQHPELMFTSQWQLFDVAVSSRNEGYTECADGENTEINNELRYLNDKGLVERDHVTKKDTFYLYKAWWNKTEKFVHICQKDFTRRAGRIIKCYSNDGDSFKLYVNNELVETMSATDNIVQFTARKFNVGDVVKVSGSTAFDEFTIQESTYVTATITAKYNITDTENPTIIGGSGYSLTFSDIEIDGVVQQNITSSYTFSTTGEHTIKYTLDDTTLEAYALSGCANITSIEISNNATKLYDGCFKECTSLTSVTIPNSVTFIDNSVFKGCTSLLSCTIPNGVTTMGEGVFAGCASLESLSISDSVTSIGSGICSGCTSLASCTIGNGIKYITQRSFYYCSSLTSCTIGSGVTSIGIQAFESCSSLTSIDIPNSVTSINNMAFQNCSGLTSIVIPSGVTSIGNSVFQNCSSLTSINVDSSNTKFSSEDGVLFNKDKTRLIQHPIGNSRTSYTIPSTVTSISGSAFYGCSNLTSIDIPDSVTTIGNYAFYGCSNLTSIDIPNSVTSIGTDTFRYCSNLTSCTIGSGVTSIGTYVFNGCSNLTSIDIPDSVTTIGNYAFNGCSGLTSCTIGSGVTTIGNYAFWACSSLTSCTMGNSVTSIGSNAFDGCSSLTSIDIPNSVTSIGERAFYGCRSLTSINIPDSVTSIGGQAFMYCSSLTSIVIPSGVASIGGGTFQNCSDLITCTIGSGVTSIGNYVFYHCSSLTSIVCNATTAPTISSNTFQDVKTRGTLTVPIGSSGYDVWMGTGNFYLGLYNWTKVEQ